MTPDMVKEARETLGLTHKVFAEKIGVSRRTVYRWERGQSKPRPGDAMLIGKLVGRHEEERQQQKKKAKRK
jgi:DNA-binding transcriptional regulator YiaG